MNLEGSQLFSAIDPRKESRQEGKELARLGRTENAAPLRIAKRRQDGLIRAGPTPRSSKRVGRSRSRAQQLNRIGCPLDRSSGVEKGGVHSLPLFPFFAGHLHLALSCLRFSCPGVMAIP